MNTAIQGDLTDYEKHLDTLIDTITTYNPSPTAASSLIEADDDLSQSLDLLARHQRNHAQLVSLRNTTTALDERIKSTMRTLAESRKALMDAAPPSPPLRSITARDENLDAKELLSYAQRISKFTVPPTHRPDLPPPTATAPQASVASPAAERPQDQEQSSHLQTQVAVLEGGEAVQPAERRNRALAALTPEQRAWLSPQSEDGWARPFMPWPGDDTIRRGALGSIQAAVDEGNDPDAPGVVDGISEVGEMGREENGWQKLTNGDGVNAEPRLGVNVGGMSASGMTKEEARRKKEEQEKMFEGFELYNPDED